MTKFKVVSTCNSKPQSSASQLGNYFSKFSGCNQELQRFALFFLRLSPLAGLSLGVVVSSSGLLKKVKSRKIAV